MEWTQQKVLITKLSNCLNEGRYTRYVFSRVTIQLGQLEQIRYDMTLIIAKVTFKALTTFVDTVIKGSEKVACGTILSVLAF